MITLAITLLTLGGMCLFLTLITFPLIMESLELSKKQMLYITITEVIILIIGAILMDLSI